MNVVNGRLRPAQRIVASVCLKSGAATWLAEIPRPSRPASRTVGARDLFEIPGQVVDDDPGRADRTEFQVGRP